MISIECRGKVPIEFPVQPNISPQDLLLLVKRKSGCGDKVLLEQYDYGIQEWLIRAHAKDVEPEDGAKFRVVRVYKLSRT